MASWLDSRVPARPGVLVAAEQLAAGRLAAFDTHAWKVYELPAHWWICMACLLPIEATGWRRCRGVTPIEH